MSASKPVMDDCYREIRRVLAGVKPGINPMSVDTVQGIECHHVFGREGLMYINPHYTVAITRNEHQAAHKNRLRWAYENGFSEPKDLRGIYYTPEDLKQLRTAYGVCRTILDLRLCFDAWLSGLTYA